MKIQSNHLTHLTPIEFDVLWEALLQWCDHSDPEICNPVLNETTPERLAAGNAIRDRLTDAHARAFNRVLLGYEAEDPKALEAELRQLDARMTEIRNQLARTWRACG